MASLGLRKRKQMIPYIILKGRWDPPIDYIDEKIEGILYRGSSGKKPFFPKEIETQDEARIRFLSQKTQIIEDKKSKKIEIQSSSKLNRNLNKGHIKGIMDLVKSTRVTDLTGLEEILALSSKPEHLNLLIGTMQSAGWYLDYADDVIESLDYKEIKTVCDDDEKEKYLTHICEAAYWSYGDISVARDLTNFVNSYNTSLLKIPMDEIGNLAIGIRKNKKVPLKIKEIIGPMLEDRIIETFEVLDDLGLTNISDNILRTHSKSRDRDLLYRLVNFSNTQQDLETVEAVTKRVSSLVKTSKNTPSANIYLDAIDKLSGIMDPKKAYLKVNELLSTFNTYYLKANLPKKVDEVYQAYLEE